MATMIVNKGLEIAANRLSKDSIVTAPNNLVWGTGTTDVVAANTSIETLAASTKGTASSSLETTTTTNDTSVFTQTLTAGGALAITEVALLNTASELYLRSVFAPINLVSGDSIVFTIKTITSRA